MVRAMEKLNIVCIFPALHSGECSLKMTVPDLRRGDESAQCSVVAWLSSSWSLVEVITSLICIVTGHPRPLRTQRTTLSHICTNIHTSLCFLNLKISSNNKLYGTSEHLKETISQPTKKHSSKASI